HLDLGRGLHAVRADDVLHRAQQGALQRRVGDVLEQQVEHLVGHLQAHAVEVVRAQEQVVAVFTQDVLELRTAQAQAAGEVGLHQGVDLVAIEAAVGKHGEGKQAGGGGAAV